MIFRKSEFVDQKRLLKPDDEFRAGFPDLDFQEVYTFQTYGEEVLITDPIYLADVYNSKGEIASFLREYGVFVMSFGGDIECPVWYQDRHFLLPISDHLLSEVMNPPEDVVVLAEEVGTDSGSFLFLPVTSNLHPSLKQKIKSVLAKGNGEMLPLQAGKWAIYYEQWDVPEGSFPTFYRNVVGQME
jgi:hypothetical protein